MKLKKTVVLLFLTFALCVQAQTFTIVQTPLRKQFFMDFLGNSQGFHYFKTDDYSYTRFKIGNTDVYETISYKQKAMDATHAIHLLEEKILLLNVQVKKSKHKDAPKAFHFLMTKLEASTGNQLQTKVYILNSAEEKLYVLTMDTTAKRIFIQLDGVAVNTFDYAFNEVQNNLATWVRPKPFYLSDQKIKDLKGPFEESLILGVLGYNNTLYAESTFLLTVSDTASMQKYIVTYDEMSDRAIPYFGHSIQNLNITAKNNLLKNKAIKLDEDKIIIDINYREDKNGYLLVFGKYTLKGNPTSTYGLFSTVLDKQLNVVNKTTYLEINSFRNFDRNGNLPDQESIGFIFLRLTKASFEFYLESDNTFVFTYQKVYMWYTDPVYIFKIEADGEMALQTINCRMFNYQHFLSEPHMALSVGDKIHVLFYDNVDNIGNACGQKTFNTGVMGNANSILASTTYHVKEDYFTPKKLVLNKKQLFVYPSFAGAVVYYNPTLHTYTCMTKGINMAGDVMSLYAFNYVE